MLRLLLLRHAKAERGQPGARDHERALAERGRDDAPRLGAYMAKHRLAPDLALVSTAKRTRETWALASPAFGQPPPVQYADGIYDATPETLLKIVRGVDPGVRTLLVVGHNPGLHELAVLLAGSGDKPLRERLRAEFPTAALAVIAFAPDGWSRLRPDSGRLERMATPRSLAASTG